MVLFDAQHQDIPFPPRTRAFLKLTRVLSQGIVSVGRVPTDKKAVTDQVVEVPWGDMVGQLFQLPGMLLLVTRGL